LEEYCEQRWEIAKVTAWQLIDAAEFAEKVRNCELSVPTRESHIRPLLARLEKRRRSVLFWCSLESRLKSSHDHDVGR
jgi:hypothetical protein